MRNVDGLRQLVTKLTLVVGQEHADRIRLVVEATVLAGRKGL